MKKAFACAGDIVHAIGHRARTEGGGQTGHRAGVSETGAVVYVVCPQDLPRQFVHQIVFFVRAFGRSEHANAVRAVIVTRFHQFFGGDVEGGIPIGFDPIPGEETSGSDASELVTAPLLALCSLLSFLFFPSSKYLLTLGFFTRSG